MKNGIGFMLFVMGAGVGVLGSAKFFKTKYERLCEEEVQEVRNFYDKRAKELEDSITNGAAATEEGGKKATSDISKVPVEKSSIAATGQADPRSYEELTDYARYSGVYKRQSVEEVTTRVAESESPSEEAPIKKKERAFLIPAGRYGDDEGFEPKTVYYYNLGDTLTLVDDDTDEEEQIEDDDAVEMFGDCLTKYFFKSNEEDVIYIRSPLRKEDYKVIKVRGYYS